MRDYAERIRQRFIRNEQRRLIIKDCLWVGSWLIGYAAVIALLLMAIGCSTFNNNYEVTIPNDFESLMEFNHAHFLDSHHYCKAQNDHKTIGPMIGVVGIASWPLGVGLAMVGALHTHHASIATDRTYKACMRQQGYDVRIKLSLVEV